MNPTDPLHRIDTGLLYPAFVARLLEMFDALRETDATYVATAGMRTWAEQDALYAQGRNGDTRPIVTHARGGLSAHNYGLAVDFCRFFEGTPSWDAQDYEALADAAEEAHLVWGGRFLNPDRPHVQWPNFVTAAELGPLRSIYLSTPDHPMESAWAYVFLNTDTAPLKIPEPPKPNGEAK